MGLSLGGGYNSQSGTSGSNSKFDQSGTSSGTTSGTSNSTTGNTQSGSSSGTSAGATSGTTGVTTTGIYDRSGANAEALAGPNGLSGDSQYALDRQRGVVQNQPMGFALQGVNGRLQNIIDNPNIPSVAGGSANAYTGSQFMGPYEQQYANDVLNPSLALFDQNSARQGAAMRNGRDAGSAFGDRATLADSAFAQDQALARAGVAGNILGQGFNTAVGAGQSDAAKSLGASIANASNATTASVANAANALTGRGQDLEATGQMANNDISTDTMGRANNQALYGMGNGGFSNLLSLMGSQNPAFGGTSSGLSTGNTSSTFDSLMNSIFSGSQSGNQSGSTSSSGNSTIDNFFKTSGVTKGGGIG